MAILRWAWWIGFHVIVIFCPEYVCVCVCVCPWWVCHGLFLCILWSVLFCLHTVCLSVCLSVFPVHCVFMCHIAWNKSLINRSIDWLIDQSIDSLIHHWLTDWSVDRSVGLSLSQSIKSIIESVSRLIDISFIDLVIHWWCVGCQCDTWSPACWQDAGGICDDNDYQCRVGVLRITVLWAEYGC